MSRQEPDLPLKYRFLAFASGASAAVGGISYVFAALNAVFKPNSRTEVAVLVAAGTMFLAASTLGMKTFFAQTERMKPTL